MDHRIPFRFLEAVSGQSIEVYLDERLSFRENLVLLKSLCGKDYTDALIYDPYKKVFLDRNTALSKFAFQGFICLKLFARTSDRRAKRIDDDLGIGVEAGVHALASEAGGDV